MAVNDKPCFDVLFKSVVLLPCSYSLESFKHTVCWEAFVCVFKCWNKRSPAWLLIISSALANYSWRETVNYCFVYLSESFRFVFVSLFPVFEPVFCHSSVILVYCGFTQITNAQIICSVSKKNSGWRIEDGRTGTEAITSLELMYEMKAYRRNMLSADW